MTHLTKPFSQKTILSLRLLTLAFVGWAAFTIHPISANAQQWTTNGNDISNTNSGRVGIGTASPYSTVKLQVRSGTDQNFAVMGPVTMADGVTLNSFNDAVTTNKPMELRASAFNFSLGNVGIGTTTPSTKLHVAGSITVDGNINAKFQDVAEWVPALEPIPAGSVVVLDSTKSNHVMCSTKGYDTRVAGVISAQPGVALGERGDNKVLVATTGRVRIKVDASQWPIQVGDLLVTSNKAGMAMKSQPLSLSGVKIHRPGTLIGKALEPLAKGEGVILVLLSLQ